MESEKGLKFLIIQVLDKSDIPLKARQIASVIRDEYGYDCNRNAVNRVIYGPLKYFVVKTSDFSWYVNNKNLISNIIISLDNINRPLLINEIIVKTGLKSVPRSYLRFIIESMVYQKILKGVGGAKYVLAKRNNQKQNDKKIYVNSFINKIGNRLFKKKNNIQALEKIQSFSNVHERETNVSSSFIDEIVIKIYKNKKKDVSRDLKKEGITISILRIRARELCIEKNIDTKWISDSSRRKLVDFIAEGYNSSIVTENIEGEKNNIFKQNEKDEYWIYDSSDLDHDALFTVKPFGNKAKILFNENHPSFTLFKKLFLNSETSDSVNTESDNMLKVLILSWAKYEIEIPEGILSENAIDYRMDIGKYVKRMLRN